MFKTIGHFGKKKKKKEQPKTLLSTFVTLTFIPKQCVNKEKKYVL